MDLGSTRIQNESNVWAYFSPPDPCQSPQDSWLNITADLRYVVWINGRMHAFDRHNTTSHAPTFDRYSLDQPLVPGTNVISVLVYSIGKVTDLIIVDAQARRFARGH